MGVQLSLNKLQNSLGKIKTLSVVYFVVYPELENISK